MAKFVICLLFLSLAVLSMQKPTDDRTIAQETDGCVLDDGRRVPVGEYSIPGVCTQNTCHGHNYTASLFCGFLSCPYGKITILKEEDGTNPYPECCMQIKCEEDAITFAEKKKEEREHTLVVTSMSYQDHVNSNGRIEKVLSISTKSMDDE